jgi:hypothetical protein
LRGAAAQFGLRSSSAKVLRKQSAAAITREPQPEFSGRGHQCREFRVGGAKAKLVERTLMHPLRLPYDPCDWAGRYAEAAEEPVALLEQPVRTACKL